MAHSFTAPTALLLAAGMLAACTTGPGPLPDRASAPASAVSGEWIASDGVAISRFNGGRFSTQLVATGETVADGSYVERGNQVTVNFYSTRAGQQVTTNCDLVTRATLACRSNTGSNFTLTRRAMS